jgi:RNA polymerase sigma-70 factor (ECF subfamily)
MKVSNHTIRLLQAHDESAFDEVYQKFFKLLKHVVLSLIPSDSIADDIVQEAFFKMYLNIDDYTYNVSFSSYLVTIARNIALNRIKESKRFAKDYDMDQVVDQSNVEKKAYQSILLDKIRALLDEEDYEIFVMRAYFELPFNEIAEIFKASVSSVTNKYHRAVKKINKEIKL